MSATDKRDHVDGAAVSASLDDLLAKVRRNIELDLRVAGPARVVTYNPATQKADLRLELLPIQVVEGEEVPGLPILLPGVPVVWRGTSAAYVTTPLLPGATGRVVFCDRSLSVWLKTGNAATPIDPISGRAHDLADATFDPGLRADTDPIVPPTSQVATVVEGPLVHLGRAATQPVILGGAVALALAPLATTLAAVPPAVDPITTLALANANTVAILGIIATLQSNLSAKVMTQ